MKYTQILGICHVDDKAAYKYEQYAHKNRHKQLELSKGFHRDVAFAQNNSVTQS